MPKTLTASQLIALLSTFPPDTPVIAAWESTWNTITPTATREARTPLGQSVIILDVDGADMNEGDSERVFDNEDLTPI